MRIQLLIVACAIQAVFCVSHVYSPSSDEVPGLLQAACDSHGYTQSICRRVTGALSVFAPSEAIQAISSTELENCFNRDPNQQQAQPLPLDEIAKCIIVTQHDTMAVSSSGQSLIVWKIIRAMNNAQISMLDSTGTHLSMQYYNRWLIDLKTQTPQQVFDLWHYSEQGLTDLMKKTSVQTELNQAVTVDPTTLFQTFFSLFPENPWRQAVFQYLREACTQYKNDHECWGFDTALWKLVEEMDSDGEVDHNLLPALEYVHDTFSLGYQQYFTYGLVAGIFNTKILQRARQAISGVGRSCQDGTPKAWTKAVPNTEDCRKACEDEVGCTLFQTTYLMREKVTLCSIWTRRTFAVEAQLSPAQALTETKCFARMKTQYGIRMPRVDCSLSAEDGDGVGVLSDSVNDFTAEDCFNYYEDRGEQTFDAYQVDSKAYTEGSNRRCRSFKSTDDHFILLQPTDDENMVCHILGEQTRNVITRDDFIAAQPSSDVDVDSLRNTCIVDTSGWCQRRRDGSYVCPTDYTFPAPINMFSKKQNGAGQPGMNAWIEPIDATYVISHTQFAKTNAHGVAFLNIGSPVRTQFTFDCYMGSTLNEARLIDKITIAFEPRDANGRFRPPAEWSWFEESDSALEEARPFPSSALPSPSVAQWSPQMALAAFALVAVLVSVLAYTCSSRASRQQELIQMLQKQQEQQQVSPPSQVAV